MKLDRRKRGGSEGVKERGNEKRREEGIIM